MHSAIEGGMLMHRQKVMFPSGGTQCAAWHYAGTNGACVINGWRVRCHQEARHRPVRTMLPQGRVLRARH